MNDDLVADFGALTPAEAAALDGAAVALGVEVVQLMEVAGLQVARCAWRLLGERRGTVAVLAGRGNNGGDGLVAARLLEAWGCAVRSVVLGGEDELRQPVARHLATLRAGGSDASLVSRAAAARAAVGGCDLAVDALLGTGLRAAPRERDAEAIGLLDGVRVLAVDVPSGLDAGTGAAPGACVCAAATCTLTAVKTGLWTAAGRRLAGELWAADIGMPAPAWREAGLRPPRLLVGAALLPVPAAT